MERLPLTRESTRTTDKEAAKRLLKDREGRAARGEVLLPRVDRITYDEAKADLVAYYKTSGNRDLSEARGAVLVVSQFTLYGDASKGRRPSFINAAPPNVAIPLYERFVALLKEQSGGKIPVETGEFGAMMEVELVNDGPVTLILER